MAGCHGGAGDGEHDHGSDDAVIEAALDRDEATDPFRHRRVRDDGDAQRGVRGRQRGPHQQGKPHPESGKEPAGQAPAGEHGQRQPHSEQPHVESQPPAEVLDADVGGVGEQHPHKGGLHQGLEQVRGGGAVNQAGEGHQCPDQGEDDGRGQVRRSSRTDTSPQRKMALVTTVSTMSPACSSIPSAPSRQTPEAFWSGVGWKGQSTEVRSPLATATLSTARSSAVRGATTRSAPSR